MNKLTQKEVEVGALLMANENYKLREIAEELSIDVTSVSKRLESLQRKYNVTNKYRLVDKLRKTETITTQKKLVRSYRVKPFSFFDDRGDFIKIMITGQGQAEKVMELLREIGGTQI